MRERDPLTAQADQSEHDQRQIREPVQPQGVCRCRTLREPEHRERQDGRCLKRPYGTWRGGHDHSETGGAEHRCGGAERKRQAKHHHQQVVEHGVSQPYHYGPEGHVPEHAPLGEHTKAVEQAGQRASDLGVTQDRHPSDVPPQGIEPPGSVARQRDQDAGAGKGQDADYEPAIPQPARQSHEGHQQQQQDHDAEHVEQALDQQGRRRLAHTLGDHPAHEVDAHQFARFGRQNVVEQVTDVHDVVQTAYAHGRLIADQDLPAPRAGAADADQERQGRHQVPILTLSERGPQQVQFDLPRQVVEAGNGDDDADQQSCVLPQPSGRAADQACFGAHPGLQTVCAGERRHCPTL